jgi:purine-binding chemotaxis protein CheW
VARSLQFEVPARVVYFDLDELVCAIGVDAVVEVVRAAAWRVVPGQPDFVAGVIDLRGAVVPVIDLRVRFGRVAKEPELSDSLIIVRSRGQVVALWAGPIRDLAPLDRASFTPSEGFVVGTRSLAGVGRVGDALVALHDLDEFLSESEADALLYVGGVA